MKYFMKSVGIILIYLLFQILVQIVFSIYGISLQLETEAELYSWLNNHILLITIISNLLTIAIFSLWLKVKKRNVLKEIDLKVVSIQEYLLPVIMAFSTSFLFSICTVGVEMENSNIILQSQAYYNFVFPCLGSVLYVFLLLVCAPVTEEFICRGMILNLLRDKSSVIYAVLMSGFIFGAIHFFAGGLILAIGGIFMGIMFGVIFVKTKSLIPAIIAHSFANIPDFIMPLFVSLNDVCKIMIGVACAIIFVLSARILVQNT